MIFNYFIYFIRYLDNNNIHPIISYYESKYELVNKEIYIMMLYVI